MGVETRIAVQPARAEPVTGALVQSREHAASAAAGVASRRCLDHRSTSSTADEGPLRPTEGLECEDVSTSDAGGELVGSKTPASHELDEHLREKQRPTRRTGNLSIRPLQRGDVPALVGYWTDASPGDLERMGVDPAKLPTAVELTRSLLTLCHTAERETRAFYSIWEVDGEPIGYASLKNIRRGESGEIHLHIWNAAARGKGYGAKLFSLSALDFFERFALTRIVCEPKVDNPMPNRMLTKAGYPLIGTRVGASSEVSAVGELNVYSIDRRIAEEEVGRIGAAGEEGGATEPLERQRGSPSGSVSADGCAGGAANPRGPIARSSPARSRGGHIR